MKTSCGNPRPGADDSHMTISSYLMCFVSITSYCGHDCTGLSYVTSVVIKSRSVYTSVAF